MSLVLNRTQRSKSCFFNFFKILLWEKKLSAIFINKKTITSFQVVYFVLVDTWIDRSKKEVKGKNRNWGIRGRP